MLKKLTENIEKLKKSPVFNISLSSKELFHSNFLSWLMENYPEDFLNFFHEKIDTNINNSSQIREIKREKFNIDISFKVDESLFIIENKVKSLPLKKQLDDYFKSKPRQFSNRKEKYTTDNTYFIILTLKRSEFLDDLNDWKVITYNDIVYFLSNLRLSNFYHQMLVDDYILLLNSLIYTIDFIDIDTFNLSNLYKKNTLENTTITLLESIKIHDIFLKSLYEEFAFKVFHQLKTNNHITLGELSNENISVTYGMTRAQGFLDVKLKINQCYFGIQIQGNHYRKTIESGNNEIATSLSEQLLNDQNWFHFENIPRSKIYPNETKSNNFNKYQTKDYLFRYRSIKIDDMSNYDILNMIKKDIEFIQSNKHKFQ